MRISKLIAQFELYKKTEEIPGAIVECGVFKGASLVRFATFREMLSNAFAKKIIGFDTFGAFPETEFEEDKSKRQSFIAAAGEASISAEQLEEVLIHKGMEKNIELIAGDITETLPRYVRENPELRVSLINLDTDIYEPAKTILEYLYPRLLPGGILILDDYGVFPGETKAVDEYFAGKNIRIKKLPYCMTPCYIVKE